MPVIAHDQDYRPIGIGSLVILDDGSYALVVAKGVEGDIIVCESYDGDGELVYPIEDEVTLVRP